MCSCWQYGYWSLRLWCPPVIRPAVEDDTGVIGKPLISQVTPSMYVSINLSPGFMKRVNYIWSISCNKWVNVSTQLPVRKLLIATSDNMNGLVFMSGINPALPIFPSCYLAVYTCLVSTYFQLVIVYFWGTIYGIWQVEITLLIDFMGLVTINTYFYLQRV